MRTIEPTLIPTEVDADAQAILDHVATGKPLVPEVARRVRERADKAREELFRQHGILDIGVLAIRDLRGELPSP